MIKKLFPEGKQKVFSLSYDDGVLQDIPFVELINKYKLKATFNLNSYLMESEFEWIHSSGIPIRRLSVKQAQKLYTGHEIASHTRSHPYMENLTEGQILEEMSKDKQALESLFGTEVSGFAVPFEYYSELIESCAKKCGFRYARTSDESYCFTPSQNYHRWQGTVFHLNDNLESIINDFISTDQELAVCQIIGHSYDLDTENMWGRAEEIFVLISESNDILPMTTIELVTYLTAMNNAEITDKEIVNNSEDTLWFNINGSVISINSGDTYKL